MPIRQYTFDIEFQDAHNTLIEHLKPLQGHEWQGKLPGKNWGSRTRRDELKGHIKTELTNKQGLDCAYCGLPLNRTSGPQIDHIAPKNLHPEYTFQAKNLIFACSLCNGFSKKGEYDTIDAKAANYVDNTFNIVHPYFNDPDGHFEYIPYNGYPCMIKCLTDEAKNSRDLFKLDSTEMTEERYKVAMNLANPLPANLEDQLAQIRNNTYSSN